MAQKNVYTETTSNFIFYILPVLFLATLLLPLGAVAQSYSGPLVITQGGTYTGNWQSTDSEIPAVEVRTSEPVIITNSNIRGAGYLIKSWGAYANITVRHTNGYGIQPTPWVNYKKARHFLTVDVFRNVVVENCYLENTAGIYLGVTYNGDNTTGNTIRIRYNKAKNIDGRVYGGHELVQFVQLNFRKPIRNAEIAWNQVMNEPNNSVVEDNISLFNTQGTPDSPIRIHNNYIQGAYPYPANQSSYSGGGILSESTADTSSATRHIDVFENQLVNLGNHSMGIAGGNHIRYHHNRAINSALYPDGTRFQMNTSGIWTRDYHSSGATYANSIDNNLVGITAWNWPGDRNDWTENAWASYTNNTHYEGPISQDTEADEFTLWQQKLTAKGILLGPNGSASSTPQLAPSEPTTAAGKITREFWANVYGTGVSVVPTTNPTTVTELTLFESPKNQGDDYGQRVRGYVTAPATGQYTFWIASDDHSELYLSTSEDPTKKVKIASVTGYSGAREWTRFASQQSVKITLEAGKRYYIEAVMLEIWGGDHLAVGWQLPNGTMERPIAGNRLSPVGSAAPTPSTPTATPPATTGKITRKYWARVLGEGVSAVPTTNPTTTTELTLFEAPQNLGDDYGQRIAGYVTAPATGNYTFWIASDDFSELYLSTSEDPAKKTKIASIVGWTNPREWSKFGSQKSATIALEAGKRYYIEAVMLEHWGGDHLAVGWQLPNGTLERPIAGNRLSPVTTTSLATQSIAAATIATPASTEPESEPTAYPNPFKNALQLDLGSPGTIVKEVVILTQLGQVKYRLQNPKAVNNNLYLDLTAARLRQGLYLLKYTDSTGQSKTLKIVKE
ncbi:PA14 domain-containing protein [Pontibacter fetidus]|uniref:T9SS type A sorting domain-containing protein n=1 Tax=Pontibacter fetidus TaxID=2700082 RepID=A0A6B2H6V0_9BACT|nr:PA14 domain-containing protein [Pontibacter fetidus]NDK55610.1 T9SS type A sorting domain-containing protein [Pontibacter fetidus]